MQFFSIKIVNQHIDAPNLVKSQDWGKMREYYHVVITLKDNPKPVFLYGDMTEAELRQKFLRPYKLGKPVLKGNEVVNLSEVKAVDIIETDVPLQDELKKMQIESGRKIDEINHSSSGVFIMSLGVGYNNEDIAGGGKCVTDRYITTPPGTGTLGSNLFASLHNPWVLGIGIPAFLTLFAFLKGFF